MTDVRNALISAILALACLLFAFTRPTHATCPHGWWIPEGVRRSGEFACRPSPVGDTVREGFRIVDHSIQPAGFGNLRVYCEPNAIPTIVDTNTVTCTREN